MNAIIGSGIDSYFEYLVKAGILPDNPELINQFQVFKKSINKFLFHDDWFAWANMNKCQRILPLFTSRGDLAVSADPDWRREKSGGITSNYHRI